MGIMLLACTTSCTNYLDVKPYGRTIPKTAEEFAALLNSTLNSIDEGTDKYMVGNVSSVLSQDATWGDDFELCLTQLSAVNLGMYVGTNLSTNSGSHYSSLYSDIRDCNIVLAEMKERGTAQADNILAAAHAIRGVCYYQLLRNFCEAPQAGQFDKQLGVPLVKTFDMEAKPTRSTMQELIDFIEDDFKQSLTYPMTDEMFRFNSDVVKGYLARLYFWTEQWDKALPLAQELLAAHPLLSGDAYKAMVASSSELAGNQLIKSYATANLSASELTSLGSLEGRPTSKRFLDAFPEEEKNTDIRYGLWVNKKRQSIKVVFCGMRAAEFKLMEAECYYHLGNKEAALNSINEFRSHRISNYNNLTMQSLPAIPTGEIIKVDAEGNALTPLMALILEERRKELFLEGDRFYEQKRNGTPEYWSSYNGLKYETKAFMYTFPIPSQDILLVDGMVQNPGYTEFQD